ncbi:MFS transporter [Streptomyces antarcticus]|uniref:MFS transporter n=1 Tax=Streptomyces antarcticus TaxID=2996458 RepID=UPI0022704DDC|nr:MULTISPECIES: MFS transporter [unclassified Streptomyces]MCY0941399.1 MFS transporter [Streptomyces sp. H34-AA3]MCY0954306.1 MFS transporter [Streptomyces sp. H27-S2]
MSPTPALPPRAPARRRRPEWAGRNYSLLTGAAVVTNLGSHGALIAASFAVLETGGSGWDVGLVTAARTLPLVLFLLVGGAIADRLPRHRVMVAANTLNCVSQAAFALLVLAGDPQLWQMMLLTALCGTGTAFFNPAAEGMLLSTVSGEHSNRAFALFRMSMNGAGIGGAALGGAMIAAFGAGWVLAVDAAAFAVAGALRAFLDVSHIPERAPGGGLLSDLREGWVEFRTRPWLWSIVLQFAVVVGVISAAQAVYGPLVARDQLGGAAPWGLALACFGVGTIGGAVLMMVWKPRRLLLVGTLCVFPMALPSAGLAIPLSVWALCGVMFVSGISIEVFGVNWMTTMHQEIPEEKFSRVSAYDWFGSLSMTPLATALAGPAESAFGRSSALWGCAALVLIPTAAVLLVPDVRRITRKPAPSRPAPAPDAQPAGSLTPG